MADVAADRLPADAQAYEFFAAVEALEAGLREQGTGGTRFASNPSTVFPATDIAGCSAGPRGAALQLNFMGLAGASSPLPSYFADHVLRHEPAGGPLRDLLAVFENRLYSLLYAAWRKHLPLAAHGSALRQAMATLCGMLRDGDASGQSDLLACAGLLCGPGRSASDLAALLSVLFGGVRVEVREFVPAWSKVEGTVGLGQGCRLGGNAVLGATTWSTASRFRVVLGPLGPADFRRLHPSGEAIAAMRRVVRWFCSEPLDFDLEVRVQPSDLRPLRLGDPDGALGLDSRLGDAEPGMPDCRLLVEEA